MKKYYFENEDSEMAFTKDYFISEMKENELPEMKLMEAIPSKDKDYFYCRFAMEVAEKEEDTCGKGCDGYEPRNGKSGVCKNKICTREWGRSLIMKASGSVKYIEE